MLSTLIDITSYLWLVWLVIVVVAIIIELLTLEFTFLMVAAGSLVGGLGANLLGLPWWAQVILAAVVTTLLLFLIRPVVLRAVRADSPLIPTNVDALWGMSGQVALGFVAGRGQVTLRNGETWTARWVGAGEPVGVGGTVYVHQIEGATALVAESAPVKEEK